MDDLDMIVAGEVPGGPIDDMAIGDRAIDCDRVERAIRDSVAQPLAARPGPHYP